MNSERSMRLAVAFAREAAKSPDARLCAACVEVLAVSGAAITVMSGRQAGPVCVSSERMGALEDLQFTLGEGPCQDAFRSGSPVLAPRLDDGASARWPTFITLAIEQGVNAVFAYPLRAGPSTVGVLTIYQDLAGDLSASQLEDSLVVAEVLAETMLAMQAATGSGMLADDLDQAVAHRAEVHQASGMVSVQLGVPVTEALARIRAHAYALDHDIRGVATDIVARRLRLSNSDDDPDGRD